MDYMNCSVDGCSRTLLANGLCSMHYQRVRRSGTTDLIQRPIRIEGDEAFIPLSNGLEAVIDAEDVALLSKHQWQAHKNGNTHYARRTEGRGAHKKTIIMHRVILKPKAGMQVDHINGNGLDNRKANLRPATRSQNMHNRRINKNNTSGYKGVSFDKASGGWMVVIRAHGVQTTVGRYACPKEAHAAYCEASNRLHGEFFRAR